MDATSSVMAIFGAKDRVSCCRSCLCYGVAWRQRKLVVMANPLRSSRWFSWVEGDGDRLFQCLLHSSVKVVLLDTDLEPSDLQLWAELGQRAHKPVYLRLRSTPALPERSKPVAWRVKRGCDRLAALCLLAVLSPIFLLVALLIGLTTPGAIFARQWHVGRRGRLFRRLTFRCTETGFEGMGFEAIAQNAPMTPMGTWLRRYGIEQWPQLINVVLGEISLVGPQACTLQHAAQISPAQCQRLNAMPGLTGDWSLTANPSKGRADLAAADLLYLGQWSLLSDLGYLMQTIPKAFQNSKAV